MWRGALSLILYHTKHMLIKKTVFISNTVNMVMVNNVNDCINELNLIFKYEKIHKKR